MSERPKKSPRFDFLALFMIAAMGVAIGCSWMLGASGPREREVYDSPTSGYSVTHHRAPQPQLIKAPLRD